MFIELFRNVHSRNCKLSTSTLFQKFRIGDIMVLYTLTVSRTFQEEFFMHTKSPKNSDQCLSTHDCRFPEISYDAISLTEVNLVQTLMILPARGDADEEDVYVGSCKYITPHLGHCFVIFNTFLDFKIYFYGKRFCSVLTVGVGILKF